MKILGGLGKNCGGLGNTGISWKKAGKLWGKKIHPVCAVCIRVADESTREGRDEDEM
jgi:hypothetical protein